jgi:hypothetical protein
MVILTPHGRDCERNVGAGERYENEGLAPEQGAVATLQRIEEIAIPVIQQILYCKLRDRDRDQCYAQRPA